MTRALAAALLIASALSQPLAAQAKPLITPKDYGKWEILGASRLSPKGDWVAAAVNRVDQENQLRIHGAARDTTIVVTYGSAPVFCTDDKWVAYAIGVSPKEREKLTKDKKPVRSSLEVRNLATGKTIDVKDISAFAFSPDGRFISMTRYAADGKRTSEVLVQDLASGARLSLANVGEHAWADAGSLLALTIDTDAGAGNAVQLYDAKTGVMRVLESSASQYRGLAWRPKSTDLAVLRTHVDKDFKDTAHVLVAWTNAGSTEQGTLRLDPAEGGRFPGGHADRRLSPALVVAGRSRHLLRHSAARARRRRDQEER